MPCSISPWAISARSMPASNQTGRATRPLSRMVHRDVGAAQQVGNPGVGRRRRGDAGEGADLDDPLVEQRTAG